jgi:hypothetical protein
MTWSVAVAEGGDLAEKAGSLADGDPAIEAGSVVMANAGSLSLTDRPSFMVANGEKAGSDAVDDPAGSVAVSNGGDLAEKAGTDDSAEKVALGDPAIQAGSVVGW